MGVGSTPIRNREEVRSWVESSPESGMSEPLPLPQALPRAALSTLIFLHLSLPPEPPLSICPDLSALRGPETPLRFGGPKDKDLSGSSH